MNNTTPKKDLYSLEDPLPIDSINSVTVYSIAMYNLSALFNGTYKILLSNGTNEVNESFILTNSYQTFSKTYTVNPFTENNWTNNQLRWVINSDYCNRDWISDNA